MRRVEVTLSFHFTFIQPDIDICHQQKGYTAPQKRASQEVFCSHGELPDLLAQIISSVYLYLIVVLDLPSRN